MAEEQRWQEPGSHRPCVNNCGFFGSPTTLDLCSKCYKDYCIKEQKMKNAQIAMESTLSQTGSSIFSPSSSTLVDSEPAVPAKEETQVVAESCSQSRSNRCDVCRKRVGLTGFKCRCGAMFCGSHRYPEKHNCGFDYKGLGREAIARANPVIMAEKLDKI
ncbi:putative Zn-finger protein [Handroanthus impetiginosus]|uniref:Putative Zn-finger protein n=1 Tax=Handroanthus impetiginosus TaxID=429701 RepID=A0A2G9I436_9LAMI|nr:putative Zn-finger protein [Handroanthus impetiginosus]